MKKLELTCIRCPIGCHLVVTKNDKGEVSVVGNSCPRGEEYGRQEITEPRRTITTIKSFKDGTISLKTDIPVKKEQYFEVLDAIESQKTKNNYKIGDIFIKNVLGTHSNIVVTGIHHEE
ncbi:MAG: DUF1667 domain-containing protein [Clostridia bacterium]|nr:DUF1667 domain-containing protein [Clostridia bacterium]